MPGPTTELYRKRFTSGTFHGTWCIPVSDMTKIADGDLVTDFTPGFDGVIVNWYWIQGTVASTAAKLSTLNLEINAVNVTGPNLATDSTIALTTAACDTVGKVVAGSAIGGKNYFSTTDTIAVEASATTAFVEGAGTIFIEYEGKTKTGSTKGNNTRDSRFGEFYGAWCIPVPDMTKIADGDFATDFTPGFNGRIKKWYWIQGTVIANALKLSTLNLEINAVNVTRIPGTNSTISLTSAACTPIGKVIAGTAIAGDNSFNASDTISVEASSTTAFTDAGSGVIVIEYTGKTNTGGGRLSGNDRARFPGGTFHGTWAFPIVLNNVAAAGDVATNFTPGFDGSIVNLYTITTVVASTGGKAATLNVEIGAVNLVAGTIALTTVSCNTLGKVTAGSAISGSNRFNATDTISIEAASVTQFSEGRVVLLVEYEGKST